MASDLSNALDELSQSARRLNDLTDQATAAVVDVEQVLAKLSIGIAVWVPFESRTGTSTRWRLGYQRAGKERKYGIVVACADYATASWSELSRDVKLDAIAVLPELIRTIVERAKERIHRAEIALEEVSIILPLLKSKKGGPSNEDL